MTRSRVSRRQFIQGLGALSILPIVACADGAEQTPAATAVATSATAQGSYLMPDEGEAHSATWMAYGATAAAWGTSGNYGASRVIARKDLMRIAANLSRFEPVKMLVSNEQDKKEALNFLTQIRAESVSTLVGQYEENTVYTGGKALPPIEAAGAIELLIQPVNDLWTRDTAPVFVHAADTSASKHLYAVNFNFNGWGQEDTGASGWRKDPEKAENGIDDQRVTEDQQIADFIIAQTGATKISTWLVLEGGGIEVDGQGTAICTESCILNPNRNPNKTKADVEAELARILGIKKVIWLPGVRAKEITDGHIDFYARFVGPAQLVYTLDNAPDSSDYHATQAHKRILSSATDAQGRAIRAIALNTPNFDDVEKTVVARNWGAGKSKFNADGFAAGYVGFYLANHCVLMARFGDAAADLQAFEQIQALYPERNVMQITTDGLANGGGTIHCATQQQIRV